MPCDEQHAVRLGHPLHPVRQPPEGGERRAPLGAGQAQGLGDGDGNCRVLEVVRPLQRRPAGLERGKVRTIEAEHLALGPTRALTLRDGSGLRLTVPKTQT